MKPFNLEAAKAGMRVCTRDNNPARIICFDADTVDGCPIIALEKINGKEYFNSYTIKGQYVDYIESHKDLMMAEEEHEGYINIYKTGNISESGMTIYNSREDAEKEKVAGDYVSTVKIKWMD